MKNLVELVLENNKKNNVDISYLNLTQSNNKLYNVISESYPLGKVEDSYVPITIEEKPSWDSFSDNHGTFLKKVYRFGTYKHMMYFINESMSASNKFQHFPELLVKEKIIEVVLFTPDINDVTEVDLKLSKIFDSIYEEIKSVYADER